MNPTVFDTYNDLCTLKHQASIAYNNASADYETNPTEYFAVMLEVQASIYRTITEKTDLFYSLHWGNRV